MTRPPGWLEALVADGTYARLVAECKSDAEIAARLGTTANALRKARKRLNLRGVSVQTAQAARLPTAWQALGEAYPGTQTRTPDTQDRDFLDEIMQERGLEFEDEEPTQPGVTSSWGVVPSLPPSEFAEGTQPRIWQPSDFRNPEVLPYEPPQPKILLLDIETAPAIAYVWRLFDENIGLDQLIAPSRMLCWAAKWYGGGWHAADERGGRRGLLEPLHALLGEADAVVTYNGDRFDIPKINGEFMAEKMEPVPPFPSIDLYRTVKQLGYQSSKLAFVGPHLGVGEKIATEGFKLWADVMANDERAWSKMLAYNKQDVALLEDLYTRVRPYIKSHPALHKGAKCCPACGSSTAQHRGWRRTRAFMIERLQCQGCGAWFDGSRQRAA